MIYAKQCIEENEPNFTKFKLVLQDIIKNSYIKFHENPSKHFVFDNNL
jgi:hypothetical protein